MPLYLDVHTIEGGVSTKDVADAHMKDVETQDAHGVNYKAYWVDESAGKIFCLVEAPNRRSGTHRAPRGPRSRRAGDLRGDGRLVAGWDHQRPSLAK